MINGRNVYLRPIESEDLEFLRELNNHPQVRASVVGWDFPVSLHSQIRWFESAEATSTRRLLVVDKENGQSIGLTGLWNIDWHNRSALSAVKLHPDLAQKGRGTDTIMATMAWAFTEVGLRRLYSSILSFNASSFGAYVKKCGWRVEGVEREAVFRNGQFVDLIRVAILDHEFLALNEAGFYVDLVCPVDTKLQIRDTYPSDRWLSFSDDPVE